MRTAETLLISLLMSLNEKADKLISLLEVGKDTEDSRDHWQIPKLNLGNELDKVLGPDEFKALGEDLAFVIAQHKLTREPEICEKVFRYMSFVVYGWNL